MTSVEDVQCPYCEQFSLFPEPDGRLVCSNTTCDSNHPARRVDKDLRRSQ